MTQITFGSKELNRALAVVSKVINKRNSLPILENVLLTKDGDRFFLTGSNGEAWGRLRMPENSVGQLGGEFKPLCLPTEMLRMAVGTLPEQRLVCNIDDDGMTMTMKYHAGEFVLPVLDPVDYPDVPVVEKPECEFTVTGGWLMSEIKGAKTCVSDNQIRLQMSNVALDVDVEGVNAVGTNGRMLYKNRLQVGVGTGFMQGTPQVVLVHQSVFGVIADAFNAKDEVKISALPTMVRVASEDFTLTYRPVDGRYPIYNSAIPKEQLYHITVDVRSLTTALKRVAIFANESSKLVTMEWGNGQLLLCSENIDFSQAATERVTPAGEDVQMEEGFKIGVNGSELLELLGCVKTDNAVMEFSDPSRAITIREEDANSLMTLLIMPMLINE